MADEENRKALCLGISRAGHDKGRLYAVLDRRDDVLFVADGVHALTCSPKRKNVKHVQRIEKLSPEVRDLLDHVCSDSDLVHVLRVYRKEL